MRAQLLAASLALFTPSVAIADDFFDLSPGPLSEGHKAFDNTANCTKCHELGGGVTNLLCLDCHEHRALARDIERNRGLHAGVSKEKCLGCHTEHKGRTANIQDWTRFGGRANFDHDKTGFPLRNIHAKVACTQCHRKKLESGRSSYVGLETTCNDCHKNPHAFTSKDLVDQCAACHGTEGGAKKDINVATLPFDHLERSNVSLEGRHAELRCLECHRDANMSATKKRTCASCHLNPHGRAFHRADCKRCHTVAKPFTEPTFLHRATAFPLVGRHAKVVCSKCHAAVGAKRDTACASCHEDPHRKRFEKRGCEDCHGKGEDPSPKIFDHAKSTAFPLAGRHAEQRCRSCHRGNKPWKFERVTPAPCDGCHRHTKAHKGAMKGRDCTACHGPEGGVKEKFFDHGADTRFPLTGMHAQLASKKGCKKCHPDRIYATGKTRCVDCHEDPHKGSLGDACDRCHTLEVPFAKIAFDHNRLSSFALTGTHEAVECKKCHPERTYKTGKARCVDCHEATDPHQKKLGSDCERCHEPVRGAPKFEHDRMTKFALIGRHRRARCGDCHRAPMRPPPKVGWTRGEPERPVDRLFPTMGTRCVECHANPHREGHGDDCASCHDHESFENATRTVHDTGPFRLMGLHDRLACGRCHRPNRLLAGLGPRCIECHREDDAHNNAFGERCGDCHQQFDWLPARFQHATVGFALGGAHRTARCRDCHSIGTYAGTPRECETCHLSAALRVRDPVHGMELARCRDCHSELTFSPARVDHRTFALLGAHRSVRCSSCHPRGGYAGTPRECVGCHETDFLNPRNRPNHLAAGFSRECEMCHFTSTWTPARRP